MAGLPILRAAIPPTAGPLQFPGWFRLVRVRKGGGEENSIVRFDKKDDFIKSRFYSGFVIPTEAGIQ